MPLAPASILLPVWAALVLARTLVLPSDLHWAAVFWWSPPMAGWSATGAAGALARHARSLAGLAVVAAACAGAGAPARRWLAPAGPGVLGAHLGFLLGEIAAAGLVLGLGLAQLLRPVLLVPLLAAGAVAGAARLRLLTRHAAGAGGWRGLRGVERVAAACLGGGAAAILLAAVAPPVYLDHLGYYLADPQRFLRSGSIGMQLNSPFDGLPRACEHLAVLGLAVGDETTVRGLNVLGLLLGLAALREVMSGGAGFVLTATAVVTSPLTQLMAADSFNDWLVLHAALVGAWALREGGVLEAGVLAGWLLSLKYSTAVVAAPLALVAARRAPRRTGALALAVTIPVLPAMLRVAAVHGQPFYPMFQAWWPTFETAAQPDAASRFDQFAAGLGLGGGLAGWLARPWTAHFGAHTQSDMSAGLGAPLVLLALPAAFAGRTRVPRALSTAGWGLWLVLGGGLPRYAYPLAVLALAEAALAAPLRRRAVAAAWVAVAGWQLTHGWSALCLKANPTAVAVGAERPVTYLRRVLPPVPLYMDVAADSGRLFAGGTTYVVGDIKAYYWTGRFRFDVLTYIPVLSAWIAESASADRIAVRFRQADVRHLVHRLEGLITFTRAAPGAFSWTPRRLAVWQAFWLAHAEFAGERLEPGAAHFYYFFDIVPRARRPWPATASPFTYPGTELLTIDGDDLLAAGRRDEARRWFTARAREWPGFLVPRRRLEAFGRAAR